MATGSSPIPSELLAETADALRHYYDFSYLGRHPLLQRLRRLVGEDTVAAVQLLRSLLLEAVETLRPPPSSPADSPAWRPYQVAYNRYILGKELADVELELGLGARQIQREQQRAVAGIAAWLWAKNLTATERAPDTGPDALSQEIARAATGQQAFDVVTQLERAVTTVAVLAESRAVELAYEAQPVPMLAVGDPALCRQLLVSLLSWIVRSLPQHGSLRIAVERRAGHVVCSLGAACSARLSLPDTLSALASGSGAELKASSGRHGDSAMLEIAFPASGGQWIVAIVEDNDDLAALYSRYLTRSGYCVVEVRERERAVARLIEVHPDVVVLDVLMGVMDGWEVLQKVRAHPDLGRVPVVVCSILDEAELAASLGADAYLRKPVRPAQLVDCVVRLLGRSHNGAVGSSPLTAQSAPPRLHRTPRF